MKIRVIAYIDGFNVYHGLKHASNAEIGRALYWVDMWKLIESTLKGAETLTAVRYYTAKRIIPKKVSWSEERKQEQRESNSRQDIYLNALAQTPNLTVKQQRFSERDPYVCHNCKNEWERFEEKQTDVRIGVDMVADAFRGNFDIAAVLSADTDVIPAIEIVRSLRNADGDPLRVLPLKPFGRPRSKAILDAAGAKQARNITSKLLEDCQLPDVIISKSGREIRRPPHWSMPE